MTDQSYTTQLQEFLPSAHATPPAMMSSKEIAALCEKEHKHITRDIRSMLIGLYGDDHVEKIIPEHYRNRHSEFVRENADDILSAIFGDGPNRDHLERAFKWERDRRGYVSAFYLDREHTLTLIAGYDVKLRKRIVDRWMELEQREDAPTPAPTIDFSSPVVMLGVITHLQNTMSEQAAMLAEQGDRLKKLDRIEGAYGSLCLTDAAKTLKKGPQELIRFMSSRSWIYKRVGNASWCGRQDKIVAGYLEHREHVYRDRDGVERVATRALVTGKGLVKLAELLEQPLH